MQINIFEMVLELAYVAATETYSLLLPFLFLIIVFPLCRIASSRFFSVLQVIAPLLLLRFDVWSCLYNTV